MMVEKMDKLVELMAALVADHRKSGQRGDDVEAQPQPCLLKIAIPVKIAVAPDTSSCSQPLVNITSRDD